jgi:hypothetical protein
MPFLHRRFSHGNKIGVIDLGSSNSIRKLTLEKTSVHYLEKEQSGILWYQAIANIPATQDANFVSCEKYWHLDFPKYKGSSFPYMASLSVSAGFANSVLDHYFSCWPQKIIAPCHGDLTFSNILFSDDGVIFIDWEHFSIGGEVWGFDLAYFLLAALILPSGPDYEMEPDNLKAFLKLWTKLIEKGTHVELVTKPISYFRKTFLASPHWSRIIQDSPGKLFVMELPQRLVVKIETLTNKLVMENNKK